MLASICSSRSIDAFFASTLIARSGRKLGGDSNRLDWILGSGGGESRAGEGAGAWARKTFLDSDLGDFLGVLGDFFDPGPLRSISR